MQIAVCQAAELVGQDRRLLLFAIQEKEVIDGIDESGDIRCERLH